MRKLLTGILVLSLSLPLCAQRIRDVKAVYTDASALTLVGKMMPTANPYHRVDTTQYKGWDAAENLQMRSSAGMGVSFKTDSRVIGIQYAISEERVMKSTAPFATRGFDLYVREGHMWRFVTTGVLAPGTMEGTITLANNMGRTMREFVLYLPMYADMAYCRIGIEEGSVIEAAENPFRHRIVFYGSSFTQGVGTSRTGMSYPLQFERNTGLQALSMGMSGHCKMQPYALEVLKAVEADAFIFDTFSNSSEQFIRERLLPFIAAMVAAHPGTPLIFQQTIVWEKARYNSELAARIDAQKAAAEELMARACKQYKDVYFIHPDICIPTGESVSDGTHPDSYGYTLWARSIEKPVLNILKKYRIR